jgi:GNAT superfamily N-acetyltransferase
VLTLEQPQSSERWREARRLIEEYAASLELDLSFQGFEQEIERLSSEYGPPTGAFFLAMEEGQAIGCIGLHRFSEETGEIKRLYVAPAGRGRGVARALVERVLDAARELGYRRLLLDTLPSMKEARSLYLSMGFKPTEPYRFNPVAGTAFLKIELPRS